MTVEATLLRWGTTVGFVGCFGVGLYFLGVTAAPWVAFLLGALVFAILAGRLWSTHLDAAEAARSRAEAKNVRRFQAVEDAGPQSFRTDQSDEQPAPRSSATTSYYDEDDD